MDKFSSEKTRVPKAHQERKCNCPNMIKRPELNVLERGAWGVPQTWPQAQLPLLLPMKLRESHLSISSQTSCLRFTWVSVSKVLFNSVLCVQWELGKRHCLLLSLWWTDQPWIQGALLLQTPAWGLPRAPVWIIGTAWFKFHLSGIFKTLISNLIPLWLENKL